MSETGSGGSGPTGGSSRPFRFGVAAHTAPDGRAWRELARKLEDLGFATLLVPDHIDPQLSPFAALGAAAAVTTTLRVGTQVLCNDLRNPVVTAKDVASLDLLSDGRADWGMGAGWLASDYEATGIPLDPPATRVDRLVESIGVMRRLFTGEPVDHDGVHYRVHGVRGHPRPVQRPHPPLLIGCTKPRMLRLAGREADIVSIGPAWESRQVGPNPARVGVEESMDRQVGLVRDAAGDRFDRVELSVTVLPVHVTDRPRDAAEEVAPKGGITPDQALVSPHVLIGTVEGLCDTLRLRRERWGLSNVVIPAAAVDRLAPVVARLAGT